MNSHTIVIVTVAVAIAATFTPAMAADWPWRGPNHNGISNETGLKLGWDDEPKIIWKAKIGEGYSSVVVVGGKLYTMGLDKKSKTESVRCLSAATGKQIWTHSYKSAFKAKYYDGGTSGTPTVDGDRVYVFGQTGELMSLDADSGNVVWEKNLEDELGFKIGTWGITGAPLVYDDLLILNAGTHGVAVYKKTGKLAWNSGKGQNGYATPVLFNHAGKDRVAIFAGDGLHAVDPKSGKQAWFHKWKTKYEVNASDPIILDGDRIFISSGYGTGCAMLKITASGAKQQWFTKEMRNQFNPSIHLGGYLYGVDGNTGGKATLNCIDAKSGELKWKGPRVGSGSLISAMGKLIIFTEKCELIIADPSPDGFKPTSRAQILGDKCWTTPTLANGLLYVRNHKGDLACVSLK